MRELQAIGFTILSPFIPTAMGSLNHPYTALPRAPIKTMESLRSNHRKASVKINILSKYRIVNTGTGRTHTEMSAVFSVSFPCFFGFIGQGTTYIDKIK